MKTVSTGPITRDEHREYLTASVSLKLWFVREHLRRNPDETFREALDNRVDIWRKTSLNPAHLDGPWKVADCPVWPTLAVELARIYEATRDEPSSAVFEARGLALLHPYLLARVDRDIEDIRAHVDLRGYQCGSLRYDPTPAPDSPRRANFHIANACYPASPFADPGYFHRCFMDVMAQCETRFQAREIGTCTWLNSVPRWREIFPREWRENMGPPDDSVCWHYGFWGQFITARKTFNHDLARQFRETGRMPFPPRSSWCTIEAMRRRMANQP